MNNLRPTKFGDIIGQKDVINCLKISVAACKKRGDILKHTLFDGSPGLGKTTLATAIANELGTSIQIANGANLRSVKAVLPYLMSLKEGQILFIDEIHRCTKIVEEYLYPAMEDFRVDVGSKEEAMSIQLPKFTLLGATTDAGRLSAPLRDRFHFKYHLKLYRPDELAQIIKTNSKKISLAISEKASILLAGLSRGTPRIANAYLSWLHDFAVAHNITQIDEPHVQQAMNMMGVDKYGLDNNDRKYLSILKKLGGPAGIKTIVAQSGISPETIEQVIEPYLLTKGLIKKTSKGRVLNARI